MKLYVVRNAEGKFFKNIGYGGFGKSWVDDLNSAKFYTKVGQAKSRVTFFYKKYPKYGCPEIMEFDIDIKNAVVYNMKSDTDLKIKKAKISILKKRISYNEMNLKFYEKELHKIEDGRTDFSKNELYLIAKHRLDIENIRQSLNIDVDCLNSIK